MRDNDASGLGAMLTSRPARLALQRRSKSNHHDSTDAQNAGVSSSTKSVEDLGLDEIQTLLDINIRAPLLCSQEAVRIMKAQVPQGGR